MGEGYIKVRLLQSLDGVSVLACVSVRMSDLPASAPRQDKTRRRGGGVSMGELMSG